MARLLTDFLHHLAARPAVYNLIQRLVGGHEVRRRIEAQITTLGDHGVVLDLGGGTGLYRDLWPRDWRYICLDNDREKLRGFLAHHAHTGDSAMLADAATMPLPDDSLDAVLCSAVSHHLDDEALSACFTECARVLRPGGVLLFLDAVWLPRRAISRWLWRYDRGSYPRSAQRLLSEISRAFQIEATESFTTRHTYLVCVATPQLGVAREALPPSVPAPDSSNAAGPGPWMETRQDQNAARSESTAATSYDPVFFARLFAIEDRHFWFRARNRVIAAVVSEVVASLPPGYRVLEIGCGTGIVLRLLEHICRDGVVTGMDPFPEALALARQRTTCALVAGDAHAPPFADPFHLIGMFDVLEHLSDDVEVLRALRAMLVPGGALVLTVPAQMSLWSYFDEASHHCRRYSQETLSRTLRDAGFDIEYISSFMTALFPLLWTSRRLAGLLRRRKSGGNAHAGALAMRELTIVPGINDALAWVLGQESRAVARRWRLPIGASLVAVARAPRTTPMATASIDVTMRGRP